jgi:hypothetical protein
VLPFTTVRPFTLLANPLRLSAVRSFTFFQAASTLSRFSFARYLAISEGNAPVAVRSLSRYRYRFPLG